MLNIVYTKEGWNLTTELAIVEVIDSDKNIFHEAIKLETWIGTASRQNEKRGIEDWLIITINNSLNNLLQRGRVAKMACGVPELSFKMGNTHTHTHTRKHLFTKGAHLTQKKEKCILLCCA